MTLLWVAEQPQKFLRFLKRNYIGSELNKEYCDIIKQRLNAQQKELF